MTTVSIHTDVRCFSSTSSAGDNPKPSNSTDDPGTENDTATPESSSTGTEEGPSLKEQEMEAEIKKLKDHLLRSYAEQENTRTIAKRDVADARQFAIKSFAKSLLDVSDNLQRALDSVSSQDVEAIPQLKTLYEGIQMTNTGLLKAFSSNGIKKYCEVPGDKFDPSLHSALMQYPDPNREPDTVGQVITVGFTLNDRVLRPAEVGVVKNP
jgi:molecular chaperone GrpE